MGTSVIVGIFLGVGIFLAIAMALVHRTSSKADYVDARVLSGINTEY